MVIRWKSDFDKSVVIANFQRRGWDEVTDPEDGDWDFYWANVSTIKQIFGVECGTRLNPGQIINHFPNHYELTRKDLMVKNIKRYQKQVKKDGGPWKPEEMDIIPTTFVLPQDYALFVEEFRKPSASGTWILKPSGKSQGKGIFLFNKLSQVKKWSQNGNIAPALRSTTETFVASRYINDPLLVGGKKFDLRLYVVVTSFKPLRVYMSHLGFGRFCNVKYSSDSTDLENDFVHLTNVAVQKTGEDYNEAHGNKWPLSDLRLYIESVRGADAAIGLFRDIEGVIIKSLKACQAIIMNDRHCFELYGFDVIIDSQLKPWLVEVNASPSLSTTTAADWLLKFKVISDTMNLVTPQEWLNLTDPAALPPDMRSGMGGTEAAGATGGGPGLSGLRGGFSSFLNATAPSRSKVGSLHLIYDEGDEAFTATVFGSSYANGTPLRFGSQGRGGRVKSAEVATTTSAGQHRRSHSGASSFKV
mmetsp:Transcript_29790/g.54592  ORF Transcript_29790/g.54592 Transcript_29790/m.54592 type:complete len:473 (-) Transcript_29790:252-1670(-)